jgi:hypothetical protein
VDVRLPYPPGARRADRPAVAKPCSTCGELVARGYPECSSCVDSVDQLWRADWDALPDADAEQVADADVGTYAWTCTDWALRQLRCAGCRQELGAGPPECVGCAAADSARWEWDGPMTANERQLRAAVVRLRAPHRARAAVVSTSRLVLPYLLVGDVIGARTLRLVRTAVLAGRYDELAAQDSLAELPALPWRRILD